MNTAADHILDTITYVFLIYFSIVNTVYFGLLLLSFKAVRRSVLTQPMKESIQERSDLIAPKVTIVAPAYNEERSIVDSTRSFLLMNYPRHDVLIVNDGSQDKTLQRLIDEYELIPSKRFYDASLSETTVHDFYESKKHSNLFVVDKDNGGKADSINVGIGFCDSEIFCAVDSDSVLEDDCLLKIMIPFIEDPSSTIAVGGTIRPVNGSHVDRGKVTKIGFSLKPIVMVQIVEYLRAFLFGRLGWNELDSTLIISGAFGAFHRKSVLRVGGYLKGSVGEDLELIIRLRKLHTEQNLPHRIVFIPDPICWTEVPSQLSSLVKQRDRWQRGLADSLIRHVKIMFNPKYKMVGLFSFPYMFFYELLGPIMEVSAYCFIAGGLIFGYVDPSLLVLFLIVDIAFGVFMSMLAVFIEETAYHKYPKAYQLATLLLLSIAEHLGYKQFNSFVRFFALVRFFLGNKGWGHAERTGFKA